MNVHHLELFYYVARHGGITEAVRNIPYGIQQPAVSGQVAQLEEYLGVTLFQRRPFALTPPGEKLFRFIQPFFSNLDAVASEFTDGKLLPLVDSVFDISQGRQAFERLQSGQQFGKIVVRIPD